MSCIEYWKEQNFPVNSDCAGSVMAERTGIVKIPVYAVVKIPMIEYTNVIPKRLKLKVSITLQYFGTPEIEYKCNCSFGISRLIVLERSPFQQLSNLMNLMININIFMSIIQLIASIMGTF